MWEIIIIPLYFFSISIDSLGCYTEATYAVVYFVAEKQLYKIERVLNGAK